MHDSSRIAKVAHARTRAKSGVYEEWGLETMPITLEAARKIIDAHLRSQEAQLNADRTIPRALHLIIAREEEREHGWIYFYDTKEYIADGDVTCALAGNWPYFVSRESGAIDIVSAELREELRARWRKEKDAQPVRRRHPPMAP